MTPKTLLLAVLATFRSAPWVKLVCVAVLLGVMGGVAAAQSHTQPQQPAPQPQPAPASQPASQPQPQPYGQASFAKPQYHLLTEEERELIADGEVEPSQHIGGGAVGTIVGLGIGHAIQGRWSDWGWIFTVGEVVSVGAIVVVLSDCSPFNAGSGDRMCSHDEFHHAWWGVVAFLGFRVWEVIDVWLTPLVHNRRVGAAQMKAGIPTYGVYVSPPLTRDAGGVAGLTWRF